MSSISILGLDIYIPKLFVSQSSLERHSNIPVGKYTTGLGQLNMSIISPQEDITSMALSVLSSLLTKYNLSPQQIGRLEVGTETLTDKSKSIKTTLMTLLQPYHDIEGVSSINACYGGTAALFNSIAYLQSDQYDHKYAIVIMTDIALYPPGPARPTGGAGAIALLLGRTNMNGYKGGVQIDRIRASSIQNTYDFYKPMSDSHYPLVDGGASITSYLDSLDNCWQTLQAKHNHTLSLSQYDYVIFHTPYAKMVQKSYNRLFFHNLDLPSNHPIYQNTYNHPQTQKILIQLAQQSFNTQTLPSLHFSKHLGNIYTGALYTCLISLLSDTSIHMPGKKILAFSYGSGSAASLFSMTVKGDLNTIQQSFDCRQKLHDREQVSPDEFNRLCDVQEVMYKDPRGQSKEKLRLFKDSYYLDNVDNKYRRTYKKYLGDTKSGQERLLRIDQQMKNEL